MTWSRGLYSFKHIGGTGTAAASIRNWSRTVIALPTPSRVVIVMRAAFVHLFCITFGYRSAKLLVTECARSHSEISGTRFARSACAMRWRPMFYCMAFFLSPRLLLVVLFCVNEIFSPAHTALSFAVNARFFRGAGDVLTSQQQILYLWVAEEC